MPAALVVGHGRVGAILAGLLAAAGWQVTGIRRHPDGRHVPGVTVHAGDVTRPSRWPAIPDHLDAVFYLVGGGHGGEAAHRAAYVDGLVATLDELVRRSVGLGRLLLASSTAVYGQRDGSWVDEGSPTDPPDVRGAILLEAEGVARGGPAPAVSVRLGGIYGPTPGRLVEQVRRGQATVGTASAEHTNRIHVADAARALAHLASVTGPAPCYLAVDDRPAPRAEVLRWLATTLGAPPPPVDPGRPPPRSDKRCANARLRASGFRVAYPSFAEGYRAVLGLSGTAPGG
jgi:nucleoside-diphosphate-sugar epimerase